MRGFFERRPVYRVRGLMVYRFTSFCRFCMYTCGNMVMIVSLSSSSWIRSAPSRQNPLNSQAASNAPRNPLLQPVPDGQKGCSGSIYNYMDQFFSCYKYNYTYAHNNLLVGMTIETYIAACMEANLHACTIHYTDFNS